MNEEELILETRKLIGRWDNIRIVGQGWAGDTRRGFQFNPIPIASGISGIPTPSGACCPLSGDCFISTQVVCEGGGGTYQGDGTLCVPDPCTPDTGACCVGSDCSIESESDCIGMGGVFQGVDTTCSPNPCPPPTGACCVGTDCTIETESDCNGMGGTYQGDDTACDPNPCEMPLCCPIVFEAFDGSGRKFLTRTIVSSGSYDAPPPPGCTGTATNAWSSTRVDTIDPITCEQTCVFVSGSAEVDVPWTGPFCTPCTSSGTASCSGGNTIFCGFGSEDIAFYTGCSWTFSPAHCSDGVQAACAVCFPTQSLSATEAIFTWSCNPAPGGVNVNATQTITLSDECIPV